MSIPESVKAALTSIEKREKESRVLSVIFAVIVCAAPIGLFFSAKGQPMMNIVLITLSLYNTLLIFWVKRDISAHAVRILRAIQDTTENR
jgi:hypothetical protein